MRNTQAVNRYVQVAVGLAVGLVVAIGHAVPNSQVQKP
jgi:hypothetical protein